MANIDYKLEAWSDQVGVGGVKGGGEGATIREGVEKG